MQNGTQGNIWKHLPSARQPPFPIRHPLDQRQPRMHTNLFSHASLDLRCLAGRQGGWPPWCGAEGCGGCRVVASRGVGGQNGLRPPGPDGCCVNSPIPGCLMPRLPHANPSQRAESLTASGKKGSWGCNTRPLTAAHQMRPSPAQTTYAVLRMCEETET